ncbi:hypothetical protein [Desulfopila sp. IMCC35008]|uniref:hypothetical protein n=1 Tax=Desulfopila sp. IMCC35008 TaxID=2653858 RepID=UPI0013D323FF|nr:hypothetical protein [Desulfopila sp. IMCC35008]
METIIFMIIWIGGASLHTYLELNSKRSRSTRYAKKGEKVGKGLATGMNGK